jgi:hypothetical protein
MKRKNYRLLRMVLTLGFLWLLAATSSLRADTTFVSGTIVGQTWTTAGSPYVVTGDILVASLAIEPGVTVLFQGNCQLAVAGDGFLSAIGTESDSIVFDWATQGVRWAGIQVADLTSHATLTYCRISHSGNSGIRVIEALPEIRNCLISQNCATNGAGVSVQLTTARASDTLHITNCDVVDDTSAAGGGGVYLNLQTSTVVFDHCNISGNCANPTQANGSYYGGGAYLAASSGKIIMQDCTMSDNTCISNCSTWNCNVYSYGGAVYASGDILIVRSRFFQNMAYCDEDAIGGQEHGYSYGGAVFLQGGSATVSNCVFRDNQTRVSAARSYSYGAGLFSWTASVSVNNCTFFRNATFAGYSALGLYRYGSGVFIAGGSCDLVNCSILENSHQGLYASPAIGVTLSNSIVYNNSLDSASGTYGTQIAGTVPISFSDVQGIDTTQSGWNMDKDPVYESLPTGDVVLGMTSPCIDAGNPDPAYNDACRPPALGTERNDMGAHGGPRNCDLVRPTITCPNGPINVTVATLSQVCIPLQISNADMVIAGFAAWSNDTLCFDADSLGNYSFEVVAVNDSSQLADTCAFTVNVSGVTVEHENVTPGGTVAVPIRLSTSQALGGYTIPLQYFTTQPSKVHLDSVRIDPLYADSAIIMPDSTRFIVCRPMQLPPLPPDTAKSQTVAYAYFSVAANALAEVIPIDTTTIDNAGVTYSYQFIDTLGNVFVPLFKPGSITITDTPCPLCGDCDCDGEITIADVVCLVEYIFGDGSVPGDISKGDVDCSGDFNIADVVYLINYIFNSGPAPCANCLEGKSLGKNEVTGAEIWLETEYIGDSRVITVVFKSPVNIAGLQIELASSANEEIQIADLSGAMAVYAGQQGANHKIGVLDITGHRPIPAGEHRALRLSMKSGQSVQITDAILVGTDARQLSVVVKENRSMVTLPDRFDLAQNCPNPFNPTTQIRYSMLVAGQVHLEVLNVLGQHVATLVDGDRPAGIHQAAWEGVDDQGRPAASGVYFYRLRTDSFTQTRRMVLLK